MTTPMLDPHLSWRELASASFAVAASAHLSKCELCRQRLLKLAYEDTPLPDLPPPWGRALRDHLELRKAQACEALEIWQGLPGLAGQRVAQVSRIWSLRHLPMAHILLQDARHSLRSEPHEASEYARFASEILLHLDEPAYLVADAQAQAHLFLAEAARRLGDLSGRHLLVARRHRSAGTGCPRLRADENSESASYLVDIGRFAEARKHANLAVRSYRKLGDDHPYAVALVKRSTILSFLDPLAGAADAVRAVRWMERRGLQDQQLVAAALASRIDCLVQAGRAQQAKRLLIHYNQVLFVKGSTRLFSARLLFLVARLLFRLGSSPMAELTLGGAIRALEPLHPQDAARAKLLLIHHLTSTERWEEAARLILPAKESLWRALRYPDLGEIWRALTLHLLRSEPAAHAAHGFLRALIEAVARPSASRPESRIDGLGLFGMADWLHED
jgi:tetratricopeptide (TPR) repeat protein